MKLLHRKGKNACKSLDSCESRSLRCCVLCHLFRLLVCPLSCICLLYALPYIAVDHIRVGLNDVEANDLNRNPQ